MAFLTGIIKVISILPSIIAAAARSANGAEMQETLNKKGNEGLSLAKLQAGSSNTSYVLLSMARFG